MESYKGSGAVYRLSLRLEETINGIVGGDAAYEADGSPYTDPSDVWDDVTSNSSRTLIEFYVGSMTLDTFGLNAAECDGKGWIVSPGDYYGCDLPTLVVAAWEPLSDRQAFEFAFLDTYSDATSGLKNATPFPPGSEENEPTISRVGKDVSLGLLAASMHPCTVRDPWAWRTVQRWLNYQGRPEDEARIAGEVPVSVAAMSSALDRLTLDADGFAAAMRDGTEEERRAMLGAYAWRLGLDRVATTSDLTVPS